MTFSNKSGFEKMIGTDQIYHLLSHLLYPLFVYECSFGKIEVAHLVFFLAKLRSIVIGWYRSAVS